jgi:hypothetical protein
MRTNPAARSFRSASAGVNRGRLGTRDLQGRGEKGFRAKAADFGWFQGLKIEFGGFAEVRNRLLDGVTLGVATFEFGTIRENAVLVMFNNCSEVTSYIRS